MADEVQIKFGADISEIASGSTEASKSVDTSAKSMTESFEKASDSIQSTFSEMYSSIETTISSALAGISSAFGAFSEYVKSATATASNAVRSVSDSVKQMVGDLSSAVSYTYHHVTEIGAGFVGLGLLAKKIFLSIGSDFLKGVASPFALTAAAIADVGIMMLTVIGYVYLATKAVELLWNVLTGQAFKNESIDALVKETKGYENLANQLGITTTKAQALASAFDRLAESKTAASSDAIKDAGTRLKELSTDDDGKKSLSNVGVTNPQLKTQYELIVQVSDALERMTDAKKRQVAAEALGIVSADKYIAVVKEMQAAEIAMAAEQRQYNIALGADGVAALDAYTKATAEFAHNGSLTMQGFNRVISDATLPILTDLANFFKDGMPNAVAAFRVVVSSIVALFHGLMLSVTMSGQSIIASISAIAQMAKGAGAAMLLIAQGDFTGAWDAIKQGGKDAANEVDTAFQVILDKVAKTNAAIKLAIDGGGTGGDAKPPPAKATTLFKPKEDKEPDKAVGEKSDLSFYETQLAEMKVKYEKENNLRELSKGQERTYWAQVLEFVKGNERDTTAIRRKMATLELAEMKETAKKRADLNAEQLNELEKQENDVFKTKTENLAQEVAMGRMTVAESLVIAAEYESQKLEMQKYYQTLRIQAAEDDPNTSPAALQREKDRLLEIERNSAQAISAIRRKQALEDTKHTRDFVSGSEAGFKTVIASMMKGTMSLTQGIRGLFAAMGDSLINVFAGIAAKWLATRLMMLIVGESTTASLISEAAALAGANGVASFAEAPWPIDMGAPFFGAAMYAAASAFGGGSGGGASIGGGGDAPGGAATQSFDVGAWHIPNDTFAMVHEGETVLDKHKAEDYRAGGMGGTTNININAVDAHSVKRLFMDHGPALVASLKLQNRNFNTGKS